MKCKSYCNASILWDQYIQFWAAGILQFNVSLPLSFELSLIGCSYIHIHIIQEVGWCRW